MFNCLDPENAAKTIDVEIHPNDFVMYIFEEGENTYADAEERNFSKGELLVAENDEDPSWWQVELDETVISPECTPVGDATERVMKVFSPLEW